MADVVFKSVAKIFNINNFNDHQKTAITAIVEKNSDIFVNLPTGFGKSLIYQALPIFLDKIRQTRGHIVLVVSPLLNLINDQVSRLNSLGITAINVSSIEDEEERKNVEKGGFQVVYGTPEAWIQNERWRNMLKNSVYSSKLCAIAVDEAHVIKQWGTSTSSKLAPCRECYSRLHEFRSLTPSVPIMALTATATSDTKNTIFDLLMMTNPKIIFESPNKDNVAYSVHYMDKDYEFEFYFEWLADELRERKEECERTIIYCQTIRQCSLLYALFKGMLGKDLNLDNGDSTTALVEMLHSCTPVANKERVLSSFSKETGTVRVLIATIAFGMGVDCKAVSRVIHFGPSKNLESYTQETGRAGRDGQQSVSYLLFNGLMLAQVEVDIKSYVLTGEQCRRATIMKYFEDTSSASIKELHLCCDYCAKICQCGLDECGRLTSYPAKEHVNEQPKLRSRQITKSQRECVFNQLTMYYKTLLRNLLSANANAGVKTLTAVPYLLGFSEASIQQVMNNLEHLFTLNDICNLVEIWDMKHAHKIFNIIKEEFNDTEAIVDTDSEEFELDDMFLEDWEALVEDEDLFEMAVDNLSLSQLQESFQSVNESNASETGISQGAMEAAERACEKEPFCT